MRLKGYFQFLKESEQVKSENPVYNNKNLVGEICVAMILLNNTFLDKILDMGQKARYSENSSAFITDLKSLVINRNRLHLGKFQDGKFVTDEEISKINKEFDTLKFNIEDDFNKLIDARVTARNIIDKLIPGDKVTEQMIKNVFWLGPNKTKEYNEDIVIELEDGRQYSIYLNKNLTLTKSSSFNTFGYDILGEDMDKLYSEEYDNLWNTLVRDWVKILFESANKNIQKHISKFISPEKIDDMKYFDYFNITHSDPQFKHLGEHIHEFDKNILKLSDLMNEIWKNRDKCFSEPGKVYNEWMEKKILTLNSKILEHLLTSSLTKKSEDIQKTETNFKIAKGNLKMKILKSIIEKLGCTERPLFFLGNSGNAFHKVPERQFFRDKYDDLTIKFDYHVKMGVNPEEEENDFVIKTKIELNDKLLMKCNIVITFSSGQMNNKLSAKFKFEPVDDFNVKVSE